MALNPAYLSQTTRTLPLAYGYVYGTGDNVVSFTSGDNFTTKVYILGDGEWDAPLYFSPSSSGLLATQAYDVVLSGAPSLNPLKKFYTDNASDWLDFFHFHGGAYGTKGLPINMFSQGPDQATELWYQELPSVAPALNLSGLAYYVVRQSILPAGTNVVGNVAETTETDISPVGIWRSTRCRIFDSNGNVTGYGFTTNPTWQMIDTILRKHIKPQQPPLAGLTNAEKACFDWPAMVAHAARNAYILPNGAPRFAGNWLFAADASLQSIMETQLRNCCSFKRERGGVISFVGDDTRASVFIASQRNLVPGSLKIQKKDLSTAPNVYVPHYRSLEIPAVAQVSSVSTTGAGRGVCTFTTTSQQPFGSAQAFVYAGSSNDAVFAGNYIVNTYTEDVSGLAVTIPPPIANQFNTFGGPTGSAAAATGGYLGTQNSRFSLFAPSLVQHRAHQRSIGQIAPGIAPCPRAVQVQYDMGNNTFDQTNRVMKFLCAKQLGADGPNWVAPFQGSVSLFLETVDCNGNSAIQLEDHDVITLNSTATPEFSGLYEVMKRSIKPAKGDKTGQQIDLELQTYNPNAATDVSDPPGNSFQTLPYSAVSLPMGDFCANLPAGSAPIPLGSTAATPYYVMQATMTGGLDASGNLTISLPDLAVWWTGQPAPTLYQGVQITGVPLNTVGTISLVFTSMSTLPTLTFVASTSSTVTASSGTSVTIWSQPTYPLAAGTTIVCFGQFALKSSVDSGAILVPASVLTEVITLPLGTAVTQVDFIPTLNIANYEAAL